MPDDPITAIVMMLLIVFSMAGAIVLFRRLRLPDAREPISMWAERWPAMALLVVALADLLHRNLAGGQTWAPLRSHTDGVLLMIGLIAGITVYAQWLGRLRGFALFGLPMMALLAGWGLCASWWTFDQSQFSIRGVWDGVHIVAGYVMLAAVAMTAMCGGLYLYVQRQLTRRVDAAGRIRLLGRTASLESIDRWLIGWATVAFLLLTVVIVVGVVDAITERSSLQTLKVIVAAVGWLTFAVLVHIRWAPQFRGRRAAMLSVFGFVIIATVLAIALTTPKYPGDRHAPSPYINGIDQSEYNPEDTGF